MEFFKDKTYRELLQKGYIYIGDRSKPDVFSSHVEFSLWGEGDSLSFDNEGSQGIATNISDSVKLVGGDRDEEWVRDGSVLRWKFSLKQLPVEFEYHFKVGGNWSDFIWREQLDDATKNNPTRYIENRAYQLSAAGELWDRWETNAGGHCCPVSAHGSISVLHKTKRNNQYKNGKALSIMMPRLTDMAGAFTWAKKLTFADGKLTVTLPKTWLTDPARQFPVEINDTFGDSSTGSYWSNWNKNQARFYGDNAAGFATGGVGTLDDVQAYMQGFGGDEDYTAALYLDNGGSSPHGSSPLGASTPVTIGGSDSAAWIQFDSSGALADALYYFALWHGASHNQGQINHDWTGGHRFYDASTSMPDPASVSYLDTKRMSMYANWTPTPSGVTVSPAAVSAVAAVVAPTVKLSSVTASPTAVSAVAAVVAPTVKLGDLTISPAVSSAIAAVVAPTIKLGSIVLSPSALFAVAVTVAPTVIQDSITVSPAFSSAVAVSIDPTVTAGGDVNVTPAAANAVVAVVAPTVNLGDLTAAPASVSAVAVSVAPTVFLDSVTASPAAVSAVAVSINPTVIQDSITVSPAFSSAVAAVVAPTAIQGDVAVSPSVLSAVAVSVDPTVSAGGDVNVSPTAVSAVAVSIAPTINLGDLTATPVAVSVVAAVVAPTVILGSVLITPASVSAVAVVVAPSIVLSSVIASPTASSVVVVSVDPTVRIAGAQVLANILGPGGVFTSIMLEGLIVRMGKPS